MTYVVILMSFQTFSSINYGIIHLTIYQTTPFEFSDLVAFSQYLSMRLTSKTMNALGYRDKVLIHIGKA